MTRRTAKTFERGEVVSVQREPGSPWVPARYWAPVGNPYHPGVHVVTYRKGTAWTVPTRRIRKRSKR